MISTTFYLQAIFVQEQNIKEVAMYGGGQNCRTRLHTAQPYKMLLNVPIWPVLVLVVPIVTVHFQCCLFLELRIHR